MAKKKDLGEGLDKLDEEMENLKNKEFRILGIKVTAMTIGAALTVVSTAIGGLYGSFMVYTDYMDMKEQIMEYEAPDMSGIEQELAVTREELQSATSIVASFQDQIKTIRDSVTQTQENVSATTGSLRSSIMRTESMITRLESKVNETVDEVDIMIDKGKDSARKTVDDASDRFDDKIDALLSK